VENDEQYSAEEKAQRIAEIDKKLATLNK